MSYIPGAADAAVFDTSGVFRYRLTRRWLPFAPPAVFICLNPSTATETTNDPTVRRIIGYCQRWGFGGLDLFNIFGLRSTDPKGLRDVADPGGPENDRYIREGTERAALIVVAWGDDGAFQHRGAAVLRLLHDRMLSCLGMTQAGHPKHPLYLPGNAMPIHYTGEAVLGLALPAKG